MQTLLKQDGLTAYLLVNASDGHLSGITNVFRGEERLTSLNAQAPSALSAGMCA